MHKAMIVDQDPMVSYLIREYLECDGRFEVVGEFQEMESALAFLRQNDAGLMILDFCLPDYHERALLEELYKTGNKTELILVTAARDAVSLNRAMHFGAIDYLVKPFSYKRLLKALDKYIDHTKTVEGLRLADQETVDYLLHAPDAKDTGVAKGMAAGSDIERRILEDMAGGQGRDFTAKELADGLQVSVVTVRRYLKRLNDAGRVISDIDYQTGGHPRIVYRLP